MLAAAAGTRIPLHIEVAVSTLIINAGTMRLSAQHSYRHRGAMNTAIALGLRDALYAMAAGFIV